MMLATLVPRAARAVSASSPGAARRICVLASGRGTFGALGFQDNDDIPAAQPRPVAYPLAEGIHVAKVGTGWCVLQYS